MVLTSVVSGSSVSLSCSNSVKPLMSISLNFLTDRWILCRFNEGRLCQYKKWLSVFASHCGTDTRRVLYYRTRTLRAGQRAQIKEN